MKITGSINPGKALDIGFVQEVVAVATVLKEAAPQTDAESLNKAAKTYQRIHPD